MDIQQQTLQQWTKIQLRNWGNYSSNTKSQILNVELPMFSKDVRQIISIDTLSDADFTAGHGLLINLVLVS